MSYVIEYNKNDTKQVEQAVKVLTSWIGVPNSASTKKFEFLTLINNSEEIKKLNLEEDNNPKKEDDFLIRSISDDKIVFISNGDKGLANGIYYFHMKLKEQQVENPFSVEWNYFESPFFETRGIALFNLPFGLEGLSTETWTFSKWKDYLERVRSFNYNSVIFLIHGGMISHPDYEEIQKPLWRYDVYEQVIKYADELGLELILTFVLNALPTHLWINYPEIRGTIELYQGITYCTEKGKEFGEELLKYTLDRLKPVPSVSLFAFEGGGCECDYCRKNAVEIVDDFLRFLKDNLEAKKVYLCTWFAFVKENINQRKIKGLRKNLFPKLPKDYKIYDTSRKTLQMAKEHGFDVYDYVFFIDPEAGMENAAIFPKPHLNMLKERIADSIKDLSPNLKGMFGYRAIPKARFINDYALGRYLWNPEININQLISEVAGLLSTTKDEKEQLIRAIQLLEEFWTTLSADSLKECNQILDSIIKQQIDIQEPLNSIQEAVSILDLLFEYYNLDSDKKKERIIKRIYNRMKSMDTFQCYTSFKWWEACALEAIKQRVGWWTDPGIGHFNPQTFPYNCVAQGKYPFIENKKDIVPWFEVKDLLKIGTERFVSRFRKK